MSTFGLAPINWNPIHTSYRRVLYYTSIILFVDDEMNLLCEVFEFLNFLVRLCVSRKYELRLKIFNNPLL